MTTVGRTDLGGRFPGTAGLALLAVMLAPIACGISTPPPARSGSSEHAARTVRGFVQVKPGGPREEVDIAVHEAPSHLKTTAADEGSLDAGELVLGVQIGGHAVAYPIRYLAMFEIVDDTVGDTPVAPSW